MFRAGVAAIVAALAWCIWWVAGATLLDRAVAGWIATPTAGLVTNAAGQTVQGFPRSFGLRLDEPFIAQPEQGWGVQAAGLALSVPAWAPWQITATTEGEVWLDTPAGGIAVTGDLAAHLALSPGPTLALAQAGATAQNLQMMADQGWQVQAVAATGLAEQSGQTLTLTADASDILAPVAAPDLPATIAMATARAELVLSAPIDRFSAATPPAIDSLTLSYTALTWGNMQITATGRLIPDADGRATGKISVQITHWRPLVGLLQAAGAISPQAAPTVTKALEKLEETGGTPDQITLPLVMFAGRMILGPMPIGPAPLLRP